MRHFHILKNRTFTKTVNIEKLWSLLGTEVYETAKKGDKAPVLDVTKLVSSRYPRKCRGTHCDDAYRLSLVGCCSCPQGFFKVLGKGKLPSVPLVVKAKYFSKDVSVWMR